MDESITEYLALIAYIAPLALTIVSLLVRLRIIQSPARVFYIGRVVVIGAFVLSLLAGAAIVAYGPLVSPTIGTGSVGITVRLDALSVIIFWLVSFLGFLIIQFSRNYLDGDSRHTIFMSRLYLTMGAVIFFVTAGNLWQLAIGWIGTSLALHQLLIFYHERHRAIIAARKKFIVARFGDLLLIVGAVLIAQAFGTADLGELSTAASVALAGGTIQAGVGVAAVLVVVAAALKSAMFPFHGWLLEVMETPTPVSALLHAGLLNAGIFLVVRLGDLVFLSTPALGLLIIVGGFTALFASIAMVTQSSVKISLAYSSAAHMGFMLMLCGFGAHTVAIMHLVAHSFYKAHAFLSSGSIVEYVQNTGTQKLNRVPNPLVLFVNLAAALLLFASIGSLVGMDFTNNPGEMAVGAIFVMTVTYLLIKGTTESSNLSLIGRTVIVAIGVTAAFFTLELLAKWLLGNAVASFPQPDAVTLALMIFAVTAFGVVTLMSALLPALANTPAWRAAYVHLKNGLYANAVFDRLVRPLR